MCIVCWTQLNIINNTVDCLFHLPLPAADGNETEPEFVAMLSAVHLSAVSIGEFKAASCSCHELHELDTWFADS